MIKIEEEAILGIETVAVVAAVVVTAAVVAAVVVTTVGVAAGIDTDVVVLIVGPSACCCHSIATYVATLLSARNCWICRRSRSRGRRHSRDRDRRRYIRAQFMQLLNVANKPVYFAFVHF